MAELNTGVADQGTQSTQASTGLPKTVRVKEIDNKSADWVLYHHAWNLMHSLYVGGVDIEAIAEQFLKKKAKELPDVYQSRVERFTYQDHVGTCVDWYLAALFETPPLVEVVDDDDDQQQPQQKQQQDPSEPLDQAQVSQLASKQASRFTWGSGDVSKGGGKSAKKK
jgi:hypothetical protein